MAFVPPVSLAFAYGYGKFLSGRIVMEIVGNQSEDDLARADALRALRWALRELTANLMRISAQAGKPELVGEQCVAVIKPMRQLYELKSAPYEWEMKEMLRSEQATDVRLNHDETEREQGLALIVKGALRMTAAELLGQGTQRSAGESMIFDGITPIEKMRERNRKARRSTTLVPRSLPRAPRR